MTILPALTRHLKHPDAFGALDRAPVIGEPSTGNVFQVFNPSTGELLAELPDMGAEETRAAIDRAYVAQAEWAARTTIDVIGNKV